MSPIGTLAESSLHAAIKERLWQPGDLVEVKVGGFWIDIQRGEQLIEIQTRSFAKIKMKLLQLLPDHPVELVYPVAQEKWIVRLEDDLKTIASRRKSPRKGTWTDIFVELVGFPDIVQHPNFQLTVLMTGQEELLCKTQADSENKRRASWRRKGWKIHDRRLIDIRSRRTFTSPFDFLNLLPQGLPDPFTTRDLARAIHHNAWLSGKMVYCLRNLGLIYRDGMKGRSYLYRTHTGQS